MPDRAAVSPAELEPLRCNDRERQQRCRERARRGVTLSGREHCGSFPGRQTHGSAASAVFARFFNGFGRVVSVCVGDVMIADPLGVR